MTKKTILVTTLVALLTLVPLLSGCGGGGEQEEAAPAEDAAATVAAHDCAGGCGMTNVPEDQLTEVEGKWYCAGCVPKEAEEEEDHSGHDHG